MSEHELKVWPEYFEALAERRKTFEIRKNDRGFQRGDILILREYAPGPDEYTGYSVRREVSYVLSGDDPMGFAFGLRTGFVALGLVDAVGKSLTSGASSQPADSDGVQPDGGK